MDATQKAMTGPQVGAKRRRNGRNSSFCSPHTERGFRSKAKAEPSSAWPSPPPFASPAAPPCLAPAPWHPKPCLKSPLSSFFMRPRPLPFHFLGCIATCRHRCTRPAASTAADGTAAGSQSRHTAHDAAASCRCLAPALLFRGQPPAPKLQSHHAGLSRCGRRRHGRQQRWGAAAPPRVQRNASVHPSGFEGGTPCVHLVVRIDVAVLVCGAVGPLPDGIIIPQHIGLGGQLHHEARVVDANDPVLWQTENRSHKKKY